MLCNLAIQHYGAFPNVQADLLVKIVGADPTMRCDQPGARRGLALSKCCVETPGTYNASILPTVLSKSGKGRHVHMCACNTSIPCYHVVLGNTLQTYGFPTQTYERLPQL